MSCHRITVIVPVYNAEKHLKECLNSIVCQSYKNIEILLIDDGSTDNSSKICDDFANKDNRIVVIHKANEGVSVARNTGIEQASGKYITFVDADDYLEEFFIENLYRVAESTSASIITDDFYYVYENGKKKNCCFDINQTLDSNVVQKKFLSSQINFGYIWGKFFETTLVKKIKFEEYRVAEDQLFIYNCLKNIEKVSFTNKSIYYYRQNENSVMHKNDIKLYDMVKVAKRIFEDSSTEIKDISLCLLMTNAIYTYCRIKKIGAVKECKECIHIIKQHRKKILFSKNAPLKTKLACFMSYFGMEIMRNVFLFYQKIN